MDLKHVLKDDIPKETPTRNVTIHKKPIQLRDIENRSSSKTRFDRFETREEMTELLNKEKDNIFKQNWNKLDRGLKINRLKEFAHRESKEQKLTKIQTIQLTDLLLSACSNNKLNRVNDVIYNKEEGHIEQLKNLFSENKVYQLKTNDPPKHRNFTKPKSNIERFLKSAK